MRRFAVRFDQQADEQLVMMNFDPISSKNQSSFFDFKYSSVSVAQGPRGVQVSKPRENARLNLPAPTCRTPSSMNK